MILTFYIWTLICRRCPAWNWPKKSGRQIKTSSSFFGTNLQQFALNGYSVGALGFIVKPIQWYSFHMYLTRALKALQKRAGQKVTPPHIVVKDGTVTRLLDAAEIAYVEVRQHDLLYNLCSGDGKTEIIKNRGSMQEIAAQLTPYGFVRCSASYLVNLRCITAVSRMNVYIGGAALPIGAPTRTPSPKHSLDIWQKRSGKTRAGHKLDTEPASPAGYDSMRWPVCPVGAAPQLLRSAAGGGCMGLSRTDGTLAFLPLWAKLLLYTTLLFGLIWFSFDCSPLHALFIQLVPTRCAHCQ